MTASTASQPPASTEMLEAEYFRMANVEAQMWWYTTLHANLLHTIQNFFGEDRQLRIFDAGCGTGGFMRYLRQHGYANIVGMDIADIAVNFSRNQGFEVIQGSIADSSVLARIGKVDVIVSMDVMCSLPDEKERAIFLKEAAGLLKDKGLMIVQMPAFPCLGGIHDMAVGVNKRYTKHGLRELLRQAHIDNYRLQFRLMLLTPVIFLARTIQRLRLKLGNNVPIQSDVKMPPRIVNTLLARLQRIEDRWLPFKPFGTSLQILISKGHGNNEIGT